ATTTGVDAPMNEELAELAASGATALVSAMGTDLWQEARRLISGVIEQARSSRRRELSAELERRSTATRGAVDAAVLNYWTEALMVAVVIGAFIEVSTPHRHYGRLVEALALAAVGVVGTAAALGSEAAATLTRLEREPRPDVTVPVCRYAAGPAAPTAQPARP